MYDRRAFAVTGPTVWNSLQDNLRGIRICYYKQLQAFVKNVFVLIVPDRIRCVTTMRSTNLHFTCLLAYFKVMLRSRLLVGDASKAVLL